VVGIIEASTLGFGDSAVGLPAEAFLAMSEIRQPLSLRQFSPALSRIVIFQRKMGRFDMGASD
jgi:hypothetical protein